MRSRSAITVPLVVVGLSALIAFQGSSFGDGRYSTVSAWVNSLPFDNRAIEGIELYADEKRSEFDEGYAPRLAAGIRRLIASDAGRQLTLLSEGTRRPFIEVSILDPGFASVEGKPPDNKTERDFEKSFIRTEVLAFFKNETTSPRTALEIYTDKEFRRAVSPRVERIWNEGEEACFEVGGVKLLLDPLKYCDRIEELHQEDLSIQHAQTVRNEGDGGHQTVFFKESLKTFVRLPEGLALHYIGYSRTVNMGGIQGKFAPGMIEGSERKAVEELVRRFASRGLPAVHTGEPGTDPRNATYGIEREQIRLVDGQFEAQSATGSATKEKTLVFGEPEIGDLDGDGIEDAAVVLVHDPGGSGMFYYIAAALQRNGKYHGTNAVLLGDRAAPQGIRIGNGVIVVNYADRRPEESMTTPPSSAKSMYLTVEGATLAAVKPLEEGEQVLEGWVTIGPEVRTFVPCSKQKALWLLGDSPALNEIMGAYRAALRGSKPDAPLFMTLAGKTAMAPGDGFGADYEEGFSANRLVKLWARGGCKSD
jgi:hypothetical protein